MYKYMNTWNTELFLKSVKLITLIPNKSNLKISSSLVRYLQRIFSDLKFQAKTQGDKKEAQRHFWYKPKFGKICVWIDQYYKWGTQKKSLEGRNYDVNSNDLEMRTGIVFIPNNFL